MYGMGGNTRWWICAVAVAVGGCGDSGGAGSATTTLTTTTNTTVVGTTTVDPTTTTGTSTGSTSSTGTTTTGVSATGATETFGMTTGADTGVIITTGSDTDDTTGPPPPVCGDGNVDPGEECDEGAANLDTGTCTLACKLPVCGDALVQDLVEECDDGNDDNSDTCVTGCKAAVCGDGFVGPAETCDDGNQVDNDACGNDCALASCGDGKVQPGEDCDDANKVDTDGCLSTCASAKCGDGFVLEGMETCDDGNADDTDACTLLCKPPACDDGIKSGAETDVDCGGGCMPCGLGKGCNSGNECGSKYCEGNVCALAANCQEIHSSSPKAPNGIYDVDLDGDGPEPQTSVECEMTVDGGGWTLVQRTVWDPAKTAALFTGYADWYGKTIGTPALGEGYRLAGRLWSGLSLKQKHMLVHRIRKATGESCAPLYYVGNEGLFTIDAVNATLTGMKATVNIINNSLFSTKDSGPSQSCVNQNGGAPWFYSGCCSTCPTFAGQYWPQPHPMANYMNTPDQFASVQAQVCENAPVATSIGYVGINDMAYYVR